MSSYMLIIPGFENDIVVDAETASEAKDKVIAQYDLQEIDRDKIFAGRIESIKLVEEV
jgi:hypothetical protein